jgi:hypothetical protein
LHQFHLLTFGLVICVNENKLSLLPARALKLFEFIGFNGDREFALSRLEQCAKWPIQSLPPAHYSSDFVPCFTLPVYTTPTIHKPVADLFLLTYHVVISSQVPLPDVDLIRARGILDGILKERPNSFLFLALHARLLQTEARLDEAEEEYARVITIQKDWRQLVHACLYDIGIIRCMQSKWAEAAESYGMYWCFMDRDIVS